MSSRTFAAKTTHNNNIPQLCGLFKVTGCAALVDGVETPGAIIGQDTNRRGAHECFFLTCSGSEARPDRQIQRGSRDDDYATGYRVVPSGETREVGRPPYTRKVPIFKWQEWQCQSGCAETPIDCGKSGHKAGWHDVQVWEKMVHAQCAADAGFDVPNYRTQAHRGMRTEGYAHRLAQTPESPMMDLARALDAPDGEE